MNTTSKSIIRNKSNIISKPTNKSNIISKTTKTIKVEKKDKYKEKCI